MIFPLTGLVFGAILGAFQAKRKGGKRADMIQWALVFAMIFGVIGLFVLIFVDRSMR